jgi:hypothetical protein
MATRPRVSSTSPVAAGDPIPANCELIEVHVSELKQLFNAIDPSPFRERDLDPNAEEFITDLVADSGRSGAGRQTERDACASLAHLSSVSRQKDRRSRGM